MLDRKFIIENAEVVKQNCANRGVTADVDRLVGLENLRREKDQEAQEFNRQANENNKLIKGAKSDEERQAIIAKGKELRAKKDAAQTEVDRLNDETFEIQNLIPNVSHPDAPIGKDDKANLELRRGKHEPREFDFSPLDHVELGQRLDLIDFEGGGRTTGHGFYFLKNEAVLLELALQQYVIGLLVAEGFTPTTTPYLARDEIV